MKGRGARGGVGARRPASEPGRCRASPLTAKLLALVAVAAPLPSMAETGHFMTGNQLYEGCSELAPSVGYAFCLGYVVGWEEMRVVYEVKQAQAEGRRRVECHPEGGKSHQQKVDVVTAYLCDHPEVRHKPAVMLVLAAFEAAWPC